MKQDQIALGIDIGGTNTKIGFFDYSGKLLCFRIHPTPKDSAPQLFIEQLSIECQAMLNTELGIKLGDKRILGVGVGAPMANYYSGMVEYAPNLGWRDVPLKDLFEIHFETPAIIENDANLAAVGENKWGSGKDLSDFVLITLGTGVGTGLILNNKLYRGNEALGGEGGHVIIAHDKKRLCSCGGMNHLESYLSAKGIKQTIKELTGEEWTIEKLGVLFKAGDLKATTIINTVADELVSALVSMSVLLGPQAFIIGGGVSKLGDGLNMLIENKLNDLVHYSLKGKIRILPASVSAEEGAIYGGAALIFDELGNTHGKT
jgi:glucokinase